MSEETISSSSLEVCGISYRWGHRVRLVAGHWKWVSPPLLWTLPEQETLGPEHSRAKSVNVVVSSHSVSCGWLGSMSEVVRWDDWLQQWWLMPEEGDRRTGWGCSYLVTLMHAFCSLACRGPGPLVIQTLCVGSSQMQNPAPSGLCKSLCVLMATLEPGVHRLGRWKLRCSPHVRRSHYLVESNCDPWQTCRQTPPRFCSPHVSDNGPNRRCQIATSSFMRAVHLPGLQWVSQKFMCWKLNHKFACW
jgi:hypothetical protein